MILSSSRKTALGALVAASLAATVAAAPFQMSLMPILPETANDSDLTAAYCDRREIVQDTLRHDFAEEATLAALTGSGMMLELWTSDLLGTWTVVHHGKDGISCIVTSGMDWASGGDPVTLLDAVLDEQIFQS
ncbi:MAG: hypothetical protein MUE52_16775 [Tabrizicola sp.]|jgi:hypothetical protein|nr:hypothetical protein [Tabrizicola sp.]